MTFMILRGRRARLGIAVAHIARYDQFGNISGTWCGRRTDLSSNVPWGLRRCKDCTKRIERAQ